MFPPSKFLPTFFEMKLDPFRPSFVVAHGVFPPVRSLTNGIRNCPGVPTFAHFHGWSVTITHGPFTFDEYWWLAALPLLTHDRGWVEGGAKGLRKLIQTGAGSLVVVVVIGA